MIILVMYLYCRKLGKLHSGLGESLAITFQSIVVYISLTAIVYYYEWKVALTTLGAMPFAILGGVFLQKVIDLIKPQLLQSIVQRWKNNKVLRKPTMKRLQITERQEL